MKEEIEQTAHRSEIKYDVIDEGHCIKVLVHTSNPDNVGAFLEEIGATYTISVSWNTNTMTVEIHGEK